jgi:hypothetical protein
LFSDNFQVGALFLTAVPWNNGKVARVQNILGASGAAVFRGEASSRVRGASNADKCSRRATIRLQHWN